jgi:hypothetical protein
MLQVYHIVPLSTPLIHPEKKVCGSLTACVDVDLIPPLSLNPNGEGHLLSEKGLNLVTRAPPPPPPGTKSTRRARNAGRGLRARVPELAGGIQTRFGRVIACEVIRESNKAAKEVVVVGGHEKANRDQNLTGTQLTPWPAWRITDHMVNASSVRMVDGGSLLLVAVFQPGDAGVLHRRCLEQANHQSNSTPAPADTEGEGHPGSATCAYMTYMPRRQWRVENQAILARL